MLEDKILNTIKTYNLIEKNDTVLVAVSGGPDSMCLLNSLIDLKEKIDINKIAVAHVNHMLREEADDETQYVKDYCKKNNIECFVKYVNINEVSKKEGISTEAAGRNERYCFFEEIAKKIKANKIALAHNYNDNAETVLMHFLRGSGISGLSGIKPYRENLYIRPIIECSREEIEEYCKKKKLDPKIDKTNSESIYTRNKIRNELIPYIEENYNSNIITALNRLSEVVREEEQYMDKMIRKEYLNIVLNEEENEIIVDLKEFNKLDLVIKQREILYIIKKLFGSAQDIEKIHIDDIIKLANNNIGNKYLKPNKKIKVFVKAGKLSFEKLLK